MMMTSVTLQGDDDDLCAPGGVTVMTSVTRQGDDDDLEAGSPEEPVTSQPQAAFAMPPPPSMVNETAPAAAAAAPPHQSTNPNIPFPMPAPATEGTALKSTEQTTYTPGQWAGTPQSRGHRIARRERLGGKAR